MTYLRMFWHDARIAVLALAGWLAIYGTALAQRVEKKEDNGGGSYVLPYAIVLLGIGLGMLFVCRTSGRRGKIRPRWSA